MSKCLALDTITVVFKDKTILQISATEIKHCCLREKHIIEVKYEPTVNYEELRTYTFKDENVEEIVQSWHARTAKEVK